MTEHTWRSSRSEDDLTGSLGIGDIGSGGGTSPADKSSDDDLDNDDEVTSVHLLGLPLTAAGDNFGLPTSTMPNHA